MARTPPVSIRDPDWSLFQELQEASGGRIVLMTLAPERTGAIEFIRRATSAGVVIALGHTAADDATIRAAIEAGATLSTHLGNGIASELPRHPNPIWVQAASPVLVASFIADGHHLDLATLRVLARAKGPAMTILVSDASPLAGLPPGAYGEWAVDPSGKIVVAGTPYLAGSNQGLEVGLQNLLAASGCTLEQALRTVTANPARLLGQTRAASRTGRARRPGRLPVPAGGYVRPQARLCERPLGTRLTTPFLGSLSAHLFRISDSKFQKRKNEVTPDLESGIPG